MKNPLILAICCLYLSLPAKSDTEFEAKFLFQTALSYLQQGNYPACVQAFEPLTSDTRCIGCWLNLAFCQMRDSDHSGCIRTMDRFLSLTNDDNARFFALTQKASCLDEQKDYSTCLAVSDKAQALIDNLGTHDIYGLLLANKAHCLFGLGLFHECILTTNQALDLPDQMASHFLALSNKASCLIEQEDYAGCIKVSNQILNLTDNLGYSYFVKGLKHKATCQAYMQDYSGCVDTNELLLQFSNTSANWINKANCLAMLNDFDGCIEAADRAMALGEKNPEAQEIRNICQIGKENPGKVRVNMDFSVPINIYKHVH